MGMGMALVLHERFNGRPLMRSLLLIPWSLSRVVVGLLWVGILDFEFGALNGLLDNLGVIDGHIAFFKNGFSALNVLVSVYMWNQAPFATLLFLAAMQSIPGELYMAAEVDGARPLQMFRYITLPFIRPFIELGALLGSLFIVQSFDTIFMTTQGGPGEATTNLPFKLYLEAFQAFDIGRASAIGVLAVILTMIVATFALRTLFTIFQVETRR